LGKIESNCCVAGHVREVEGDTKKMINDSNEFEGETSHTTTVHGLHLGRTPPLPSPLNKGPDNLQLKFRERERVAMRRKRL